MKKSFLLFALLTAFFGVNAQNMVKSVNSTSSIVNWKAYKVTGSHEGTIGIKNGSLTFAGDVLKGGEFLVDMNSINCTDLSGQGKSGLEGHLKNDDFFGVAKNPTAKFVITKVAPKGKPGEYKVTGNMTIKGVTKEVRFDTKVVGTNATAAIKLDRTDFDIKYGSGSFFESLGDKTIYDEFDLNISLNF
jgi:polyisoprenoid-binding protein YceI